MNVSGVKEYLKPFIDLIKESGADYFWVASGAIRDYFVTGGMTPKDIDIFFSDRENRDKAIEHLFQQGFKTISYLPRGRGATFNLTKSAIPKKHLQLAKGLQYQYHSMDIGCWDGKSGDPNCYATTPEECIKWFDFTIEMAALDSNNEFFCHPEYEHHITNKILVRNSIQDAYPRGNNRRLLKYVKNGFTIDQENLLTWLEDQEATFEYRRRINKERLT